LTSSRSLWLREREWESEREQAGAGVVSHSLYRPLPLSSPSTSPGAVDF
jgi:hypothetical protein